MRIPIEKSIYRKVYLQLRTGFLTERPAFYDAVRTIPPPVFTRASEKLPNLVSLEDKLMKKFQSKYPYHFEDFVSDNPDSTQYVAYNFAKRQSALMRQGMSEKRSFERVEKEFLAERDAINSRLFVKSDDKEKSLDKKLSDKDKSVYQYMNVCRLKSMECPDSMFHSSLTKELNRKQRMKIHNVIDRTIDEYKRQYGDHIIEEKLKALEHYRLDKPHTDEDVPAARISEEGKSKGEEVKKVSV